MMVTYGLGRDTDVIGAYSVYGFGILTVGAIAASLPKFEGLRQNVGRMMR